VAALGDKATVQESPFMTELLLSFNTERAPFSDPRVRRALTLAIDRELGSQNLSKVTILGKPAGLLRPGYALASTPAELASLPGLRPGHGGAARRGEEAARRGRRRQSQIHLEQPQQSATPTPNPHGVVPGRPSVGYHLTGE